MQRRFPTRDILALVGAAFFLAASGTALAFENQTANPARIQRSEPSSWWIGMQMPQVQIMVYGQNLAELEARTNYPGVTLQKQTSLDNPNYAFLDLEISPHAAPGKIKIDWFAKNAPANASALTQSELDLLPRREASAQRRGFTPADAIYLVVPDRFANGDISNDNIKGMREVAKRSDPGGRHGGDIAGMRQHLDYIAGLGFTMLWPTPLVENDQVINSYHGYSATDFYRVDPRFGSNQDYRDLVRDAKQRGIGVIHDVVLNHIGSYHWWMRDLPSKDWINYRDAYVETNHVRATVQDPHAAQIDQRRFDQGWFVPTMPDLNQNNPYLATYLIQNALWWIEYADLSGLRVDTYSYSNKHFLAQWSKRITDEYPHLNIVGEEWSMNPAIVAYWQKGKVNQDGYRSYLPSMMDFSVYDSLHLALSGKHADVPKTAQDKADMQHLYLAAANDFQYADASNLTIFEGNHDTPRIFSSLGGDPALYRMALVYLATMRGIPQMFYGTELQMRSPQKRDDGKVRGDFPGGWQGDRANGFTGAALSKAERESQDFVRRLFTWRKTAAAIHQGRLIHFIPENNCYVYFRVLNTAEKKSSVMVVLNRHEKPQTLDLQRFREVLGETRSGREVLTQSKLPLERHLVVAAKSAMIIELE